MFTTRESARMSRHITCDFCGEEVSRFEEDNVKAGALLGRGYEWTADFYRR